MNGEVLRQQPKTGSYIENLEQVNFILNISAFQLNIQIKPINPIKITNPGGKDTPQAHHLNSTRILPWLASKLNPIVQESSTFFRAYKFPNFTALRFLELHTVSIEPPQNLPVSTVFSV